MIVVTIKRTKAWDSEDAPIAWGFFNVPSRYYSIFKDLNRNINDNKNKFYYNNTFKIWYTLDKKSVDKAIYKFNEHSNDIKVKLYWNII